MFCDTEGWRKVWRKTVGSKNDMKNLVNFYVNSNKPESLQLKSTEKWSLMTLKKDPNFEQKLTFHLKNDMNNLVNFNKQWKVWWTLANIEKWLMVS